MRILLDCDVLLDVALNRLPHAVSSGAVLDWAESHPGKACVAWHTVSNLHYLCDDGAFGFVRELIAFCEIPATGTDDLRRALDLGFADLEDAMQVAAALTFGAQVVITRNLKDYRKSPVKVMTPEDALSQLK